MVRQAIILAAGEGQRLRPFTAAKPKVMLRVGGKAIIEHVIEALAGCRICDIIIVAGYHREQIYDAVGDGRKFGVSVRYVVQEQQIGTAHALMQAADLASDTFLVLPGDQYITADTVRWLSDTAPWALLSTTVADNQTVRYGVVNSENGALRSIIEKPRQPCHARVSTGIFALSRAIFDHIKTDGDMPAVVNRMIGSGIAFQEVETQAPWLDVIYPWDLIALNDRILRQQAPLNEGTMEAGVYVQGGVTIGVGSRLCSGGYLKSPVKIGQGCRIGPNVVIGAGVSIGDNVNIGPFSVIEDSIIGNDITIGPGSYLYKSVVDSGCQIGSGFKAVAGPAEIHLNGEFLQIDTGSMVGGNCRIAEGVVASPGSIIGNGCSVAALKVIKGNIADGSQVV
ncbi:MAG: sugar phosphate nucleotidyltransferase [Dehalogenimonas sp.]|uniref:Sugar phosphate nucleotidyltransferase n=1 Tax=Candidatus Dehalogenimonas loeffleri TaxID=3127115 RepID=A0ABZ2J2G6_9CHLR|nr:sugar phosphate nucleotidyltransferase [Dehalogenimonas sp.]